jgi:hypothetical protein
MIKSINRINKKGDITDMIIFLVVLFILAIGFFIFAFVVPQISSGLNDAGLNNTPEGANAISDLSDFGTITIQKGFFLVFVGLIISTMVTSFFARTHPLFLFLYILVLGITVFVGVYLGNAYEQFSTVPIFADTLASQTLINLVMQNVITITIAVGALSMIIVFAKFSTGGVQRI